MSFIKQLTGSFWGCDLERNADRLKRIKVTGNDGFNFLDEIAGGTTPNKVRDLFSQVLFDANHGDNNLCDLLTLEREAGGLLVEDFRTKVEGDELAKHSFREVIESIWANKPALIQKLAQDMRL